MSRSNSPKSWSEGDASAPLDALNRSIADLEARIRGLNARNHQSASRSDTLGPVSETVLRQRLLEREQQDRRRTHSVDPNPASQVRQPHSQPRERRNRISEPAQSVMRETSGAMRDIAEALVSLRDDLRRDISDNINREFGSLRRDVDEIKEMTGTAARRPDLGNDLANLANQLEALEARRGEAQSNESQSELDDLRRMVNELAREDSMRRLESRWDGLEERISGLDPSEALREDLITLSYRLDDIKSSIGQLPSALPLNQLEDKIKMLVSAIDAMARQPAAADPEIARQFSMVDQRLDEISRAIVASSVSHPSGVVAADINRLEDRLESVIDSVAKIADAEASNIEQLQTRLDAVADSVTRSAAADASNIRQLEERLNAIVDSVAQSAEADASHVRLLEERLSSVVDSLTRSAEADASAIQTIEARLEAVIDDVVASSRSDSSGIGQLQDRLDAVVDHIGRMDQAQREEQLPQRLEALSVRVEELANEQPYEALLHRLDQLSDSLGGKPSTDPQLVGQLEEIARKVETLDFETMNAHLGDQLKALSLRIDNINGDLAATNSNQDMLYGRLEDLAGRVEDSVAQQQAMDFAPLERRLAEIADRLDETRSAPAPHDESIRNLEAQVASLSKLLTTSDLPGGPSPELDHRLSAIEDQLLSGRTAEHDMVIETARQAAEAAVASYEQSGAPARDVSTIETLVGDLRSLEDLSRKTEERNAKTIDAVHDTLLKIAGRLEHLEAAGTEQPSLDDRSDDTDGEPAPDVAPADPQGSEPRRAFLSGLVQRVSGSSEDAATTEAETRDIDPVPSIDPVSDIDPETANMPLEPGSGAPDIKHIMAKVREAQSQADREGPYSSAAEQARADKADFIAAARRAARAAATEAADLEEAVDQPEQKSGGAGQVIRKARRPLLLAAGAILLAVVSFPLVTGMLKGNDPGTRTAAIEPPVIEEAPVLAVSESEPVSDEIVTVTHIEDGSSDLLSSPPKETSVAPGPSNTLSPTNEIQITDVFQTSDDSITKQLDSTNRSSTPGTADPMPDNGATQAPSPQPVILARDPVPMPEQAASDPLDGRVAAASARQQDAPPADTPPQESGPAALREAASSGDPLALFEIGARYSEGRGVATDMAEAAKWYEYAASRGFAPAQYRLANFLEKGIGLERDLPTAMDWYDKAARQGNASAMHNLAVLNAMGQNGEADYDSASGWFTKAAEFGVTDSQYNLAILYARGSGVEKDLEQSYKWFAIAAKAGDEDAAEKRDEVASALTPEQLEKVRAQVEVWTPASLDQNANSVVIPPEWRGVDTQTASVDTQRAVRNIQAILSKNGFDTGGVDGVMGHNTVAAIKAFQKSIGREPTGKLDDALVRELLSRNN